MSTTIWLTPARVDLVLYRGDDAHLAMGVTNPDGTPVDFTGAAVRSQIRISTDDPVVLAEFTATIVDNIIYLDLAGADTATLPDVALWDVQVTAADATVGTVAAGRITATGEITR
jgi:hypothetical protein